ncbi:MAG TPA: heme exporter protein CcmB [bacterium]|nr:heme exporter protein CcmB [bacterium]
MRVWWVIVRKDLTVEGRARDLLPAMAILVLLLLAMTGATGLRAESAPAILWISVAVSAAYGLTRSFHQEIDQDQLHGLRLAAVDPALIYLGKAAANFLIVTAVEVVALAAVMVFFDVSLGAKVPALAGVLLLGTAGLVAMGTLLAAMLAASRMRESLLPVLLLPLAAPAVMAAAGATAKLFRATGEPISGELRLLLAFALLFVAAAMLVFEHVIED